jgi:small subunit ribosomal protein S6
LNKYEGMFLLDHGKLKDVQKGVDVVTELLKKHGANIVKIGKWDERKLAYEINNQKRGTYILCHFEAPSEAVAEVTHDLNLTETISRHLIIRLRKRFPQFLTAAEIDATYGTKERERAARRGRDDDAVVGVLDDVVDRDLG